MRLKFILSAIVLCCASTLFAQNPADSAFSKIYVSIEGGEMYPFGDLIDAVENSFYGGVGFRYSYWDDFDGFVNFNYAYVKVRPEGIPYPGVHQFVGRLGLDWHWKYVKPLAIGAGFTCNWARADYDGEDAAFSFVFPLEDTKYDRSDA